MKRYLFLFISMMSVLCIHATEFTVNGINYKLISATDRTCEVMPGTYQGNITIPETVEYGNRQITVIKIGEDAFYKQENLTGVTLPGTLKEISKYAFGLCTALESLSIPGSVTTIEKNAFNGCGIKELRLEWSSESERFGMDLGDISDRPTHLRVFHNCPNLEKVYIDRSLPSYSEFGDRVWTNPGHTQSPFMYHPTIKEVEFGPHLLGTCKLTGCEQLQKVVLSPAEEQMLCNHAFYGCKALNEVVGLERVTYVGYSAFGLTPLTYSLTNDNITFIEQRAFAGTNIIVFKCGNPNLSVGSNAFYQCYELKEVYLNTNGLGSKMFDSCKKIENLTFGPEVSTRWLASYIGPNVNIKNLHMQTSTPPVLSSGFEDWMYVNCILHVPAAALEAYKAANIWKEFWNIVGDEEVAGIEDVQSHPCAYFTEPGAIIIDAEPDDTFTIFSVSGTVVYSGKPGRIAINAPGIYIIRDSRGASHKVIVN